MAPVRRRPDPMVRLGSVIRERREMANMSQQELGARAKLHRNYIGDVERATRNITILSLIKLAEGLEVTAAKLLEEAGL